jgi:hypothetical protein
LKKSIIILSLLLLLLSIASCGVRSKTATHALHEVQKKVVNSEQLIVNSATIIKGDSVLRIESSFVQATLPFAIDANCAGMDSVVSNDVKVYLKPVFITSADGTKIYKGMQVQAITPAKTIKHQYTVSQQSTASIAVSAQASTDSSSQTSATVKNSDTRAGGYATTIIVISLLCAGIFIAQKLFTIKKPF